MHAFIFKYATPPPLPPLPPPLPKHTHKEEIRLLDNNVPYWEADEVVP